MKRSNKILISIVFLTVSWLILNGWLQANAFKNISSGKVCSYAKLSVGDDLKPLNSFKNIIIDFGKKSFSPKITIKYGLKQELQCSNNLKNAISYSVCGDTLCLKINYQSIQNDDYFDISIPLLKSLNISSVSEKTEISHLKNNYIITIMGFKAGDLIINNNSQFGLLLEKNKLRKLELQGDFHNNGKAEISEYTDYDSLKVDITGKQGTLIFNQNPPDKVNPKQWISIKVPGTLRIESDAVLADKIIIKK
jgi:hypothetical protein